mgnify:CR=1 FL=1
MKKELIKGLKNMAIPGSIKELWVNTKKMIKHNKYFYDKDRNIDPWKPASPKFSWHLDQIVNKITDLLKEKNAAYGDTALNPTNIFSKLKSTEAICARIDDKLARIGNKGINDETEDTIDDLIGYLLLLKMSMDRDNKI